MSVQKVKSPLDDVWKEAGVFVSGFSPAEHLEQLFLLAMEDRQRRREMAGRPLEPLEECPFRKRAEAIGQKLYAEGGILRMHEVFEEFEKLAPDEWRRGPWLDHAFNGVGRGQYMWWA